MATSETNSKMPTELDFYAIHEAGHAIVGRVQARSIGQIGIVVGTDESYFGYVTDGWSNMYPDVEPLVPYNELGLSHPDGVPGWEEDCTFWSAGKIAELLLAGRAGVSGRIVKADDDMAKIMATLHRFPQNQRAEELRKAEFRAKHILVNTRCWHAVEALAGVLIHEPEHKLFGEERVHSIISQALKP